MEIKKDLILTKDTEFSESIIVHGNISGNFSLKVLGDINAWDINTWDINARNIDARNIDAGNIDAWDINAWDINAWDINARNIDARNIDAGDINARDINAGDINAGDINAFAFIVAYTSFKCKSWETRRENGFAKCLDREIEYKITEKTYDALREIER